MRSCRRLPDPAEARIELAVVTALWEGLAAEWACQAPRTYPDGSPYEAGRHLAVLARIAAHVSSLQWNDPDRLTSDLTVLMVMVRDVDRAGPDGEQLQALIGTCAALAQRGLGAEAAEVAEIGAAVNRFWEQSLQRSA